MSSLDRVTHAQQPRVIVVGLGAMGAPMARMIAAAGTFTLSVYDADPSAVAALADVAAPLQSLQQSLSEADFVVLMLPNSNVVEGVLVADGGLDRCAPGTTIIDMGSSRPASTVALAARANSRGVGYLDAPVSGGRARAQSGRLSIMVGGDAEVFAHARPLLDTMGESVVAVGDSGSGHALKSLNNLLSAIGLAAAAEILGVGTRFGLDPAVMLEVINASTGRNQATEVKFAPYVLTGTHDSGFALELMIKDLRIALELAAGVDAPTPLGEIALEAADQALADYDSPEPADHTILARWVAGRAGVDLHRAHGQRPADSSHRQLN
jgi:3-hydroxyisobutyrate dehydrogenase